MKNRLIYLDIFVEGAVGRRSFTHTNYSDIQFLYMHHLHHNVYNTGLYVYVNE